MAKYVYKIIEQFKPCLNLNKKKTLTCHVDLSKSFITETASSGITVGDGKNDLTIK